jgi:hypothetical protein
MGYASYMHDISLPAPAVIRGLIAEAIALCGGSEKKLGKAIGYSQNAVWSAKVKGLVSPKMATQIDVATGGRLPRSMFRPDIFSSISAASTPLPGDSNGHAAGSCGGSKSEIHESPLLAGGDVPAAVRVDASG